ncbi:hypothetical protein BDY21DRAFT_366633 [Lineolata rhizophorae]|uniref:peptidylprolyl isomerase n=1 Tax=Lineolata rhizophorae TaxID=578093 RepID=A0A6A6NR78_9PEZI|nr:hypothetical protein BDY21DRAFT_366633 [Lineolata rhizophorae]
MQLPALRTLALLALPVLAAAIPENLGIEVTQEASCSRKTQKGDKIDVHYRGTLQSDGTEFDASYNRGTPLTFTIGGGMVINGWDEGLLDMCPGEKRKLTIPPELGYGDRGVGPIPGGATLVFDTELVNIHGVEKEEL